FFFFFQAEDGIRDRNVTGVQTCALPICQRLARIGEGVIDEVLLLAALGHADLDLAAALDAQGLGQQRALLDLVGDEDCARARLRSEERRVGKGCRWWGGAAGLRESGM